VRARGPKHGNSSGMAEDETPELLCPLLDLPAELLVAIATHLTEDDELAASLACRKLRQAVAGTERRKAGARLSTRIDSALGSVGKLQWATSRGIPLDATLLTRAARHGQLEPLRWLRAYGWAWEPLQPGVKISARARLKAAICPCCSGRARMAARGTGRRARTQLRVGTCPCCSGLVRMAARCMRGRAGVQPRVGTWPCCSGLVRMAARGIGASALLQLGVDTRQCCSGLAPMDALSASEEGGWLGPGQCAWQRGPWLLSQPVPCGRTGMDDCSGSVTVSGGRVAPACVPVVRACALAGPRCCARGLARRWSAQFVGTGSNGPSAQAPCRLCSASPCRLFAQALRQALPWQLLCLSLPHVCTHTEASSALSAARIRGHADRGATSGSARARSSRRATRLSMCCCARARTP
jgi:hypothetical protein